MAVIGVTYKLHTLCNGIQKSPVFLAGLFPHLGSHEIRTVMLHCVLMPLPCVCSLQAGINPLAPELNTHGFQQ
jgi:hypothetical protein